ncbi:SRPBCC family protein [Nocardioides sp. MAHUQ-72]|uniref:SRPBCC family protein n=1 Tax=unclassified Nocardioides TaxID=2615069 RepID=UPI00362126B0
MSHFEVVRSTQVQAEPARVHALVVDFHAWTAWSPWEGLDPDLRRTYSGPDSGVGAYYAWAGNRKAGEGSMEITSSTSEAIGIKLAFLKPWAATNDVTFTFVPTGSGTEVTWRMDGEHRGFGRVLAKVVPMDRLVGRDFEKGLARLRAVAEAG